MVGAILTQQCAWVNVEKAIEKLKRRDLLDPRRISNVDIETLKDLTRPCGFYKTKPARLKALTNYLIERYDADLDAMFSVDSNKLREELLSLRGIGPETADSILLYAGEKPFFVVDAYTRRIGQRVGLFQTDDYGTIQRFFQETIPKDVEIYKEFHALIVRLGREICLKNPKCERCPLADECDYASKKKVKFDA